MAPMFGKLTALLAFILLLAGCGERTASSNSSSRRIVSIAPNVTEILYTLGQSNQVVGVSRYSNWPPDARNKPHVGGTYDPNWEMILSLRPDLVIGLDSQKEIAAQLKQLGVDFLGVPHERVKEIMQSILIIGKACSAEEKAHQIFQGLEKQIQQVPTIGKTERPKVLVCIGHDEQMTRMYVAARHTFYDDLIDLAGGTNACEQTTVKYPEISPESLHAMQPDLIIDIAPNLAPRVSQLWEPYHAILMTNSYAFIPGPRFGLLLEDFTKAIHECSHPDQ
ncbi:ABC transporter substrate-binding protein [Tichowtungia aerotolerans]|uniref:ABC transporter substrate-binding protein n=1 Tax=Tichowtungia aerotolerans TaxID=2697043 RepID=A0A6P1M877_9BACT|nr:helical backbone metal receptor [Tichowtungia aerotolerans]QHI70800.1 ABC transporter substrate-binding protein [Tichowtungia aerotolerans]